MPEPENSESDHEVLRQKIRDLELELDDLKISYGIILDHNSILEDQLYSQNCDLQMGIIAQGHELEAFREQNEKARQHLITSERLVKLGEQVAGMTHELNSPLGVAVTAASYQQTCVERLKSNLAANRGKIMDDALVQHCSQDLDGIADTADMILSNLRRASETVSSFKQVAVDQSSDMVREFTVKTVLQQTLTSLKPLLRGTLYSIEFSCPADLVMQSYPGTLSQIVTNLVMNSLVHGFSGRSWGSIRLTVVPTIAEKGPAILIQHEDNGHGISAENLPRIFDQFFTTRQNDGGSGLGLSIVRSLVAERLGGTICCSSHQALGDEGGQTVFEISLPQRVNALN